MKHDFRIQKITLYSALASSAVLAFDLYFPLGVAGGAPYILLVLIGLYAHRPNSVIVLAALGSILTIVGYYLSPHGGIHYVVLNRGLALFAIWTTAVVAYMHLKALARLEPLATIDQLTGLYNRHYFTSMLVKQINIWRRYQRPLSLLMLDIDFFKQVNDTYGHQGGDAVLKAVADICKNTVRDIDIVARIGGEEFAILLPSALISGAMQTAERIRAEVEKSRFQYEDKVIQLTVSLGAVELVDTLWTITEFMKSVDDALYKAKKSGRNCCVSG